MDEYWAAPLDTRMESLGGEVFRRNRGDFEDEQYKQNVQAWHDELDALKTKIKESSDETKAKLEVKKEAIRKNLEDAKLQTNTNNGC